MEQMRDRKAKVKREDKEIVVEDMVGNMSV